MAGRLNPKFNWKLRAQLLDVIRTAQSAGQPGLSSWQCEGLLGKHHGRVSGTLSEMHHKLGDLTVVPGVKTTIPETRGKAGVYAIADAPPSGTRQLGLGLIDAA